MKFSGKVGNGPMNKWLNFAGDPVHRLDTEIIFRIRHYWEIRKVVSTDCAVRHCSIATMTSLRHRPTTDSGTDIATLVRRVLPEVCTVPVLLVVMYSSVICYWIFFLILWLLLKFLSSVLANFSCQVFRIPTSNRQKNARLEKFPATKRHYITIRPTE